MFRTYALRNIVLSPGLILHQSNETLACLLKRLYVRLRVPACFFFSVCACEILGMLYFVFKGKSLPKYTSDNHITLQIFIL